MKTESFIALRYLKAKRKKHFIGIITFISIAGIIIGTMSLVVALSLMQGFHDMMQVNLLSANSHLTVHSLNKTISAEKYHELETVVSGVNGYVAHSPMILTQGLLRSEVSQEPSPVVIKGINLEKEKAVTGILDTITFDSLEPDEVIVGSELAKRHGIFAGDRVSLVFFKLTQTPLGPMPRIRNFKVAGVFSSGIYEYDKTWIFTNVNTAASVMGLNTDIEFIELRTTSIENIDAFKNSLKKVLPDEYFMIDLRETNSRLFAAIKVEKIIVSFIIGLIVLVAALNITSSLVLTVVEKNRDIGILMAMGLKKKKVMKIFQYQGLIVGIVGSFAGCFLGSVLSYYFDKYKIIKLPPDVYDFLSYIPFHLQITDVILIFIGTVIVSWGATVYPASRAANLNPVEAIRHE